MFNLEEWAEIFKDAYGIRSERVNGVLMFDVRKGMEMNLVGDYVDLPKELKGMLRTTKRPEKWNSVQNLETYRLKTVKPFENLLKEDIHQKTRNLIVKAEKNLVETRLEKSEAALREYYRIYVRTMLRISAIPQSFRLFSAMWRKFGGDSMKVFLTRHEGKVVAGIVALYDSGKKRLHIWSNASSSAARPISANMGCYAGVLKFACESPDILEVDFGNTEPGSSLAFFKSRFGAKAVPVWTVSSEPISEGRVPTWPAKILFFLPVPCVSLVSHLLFRFVR